MVHSKSWRPDRPVSKGATAYHDAVINASWHKENVKGLIDIMKHHVKDGHVVVDFGAGTGGSAFYLLQNLPSNAKLWLIDNSPSWLGKAYAVLSHHPNVSFSLLEKINNSYALLHEILGEKTVDHVISANTFHLIANTKDTFVGIYYALRPGGTFTFQSGNIFRREREKGILMLDDTVTNVHDKAIKIIQTNPKFAKYRKGLDKARKREILQRKLIFPDPRPIEHYMEMLKATGFRNPRVRYKRVRVTFADWLTFLRVKRLGAGILPEIGGREASPQEERHRDELITKASKAVFEELIKKNSFANAVSFTAEWVYIKAEK